MPTERGEMIRQDYESNTWLIARTTEGLTHEESLLATALQGQLPELGPGAHPRRTSHRVGHARLAAPMGRGGRSALPGRLGAYHRRRGRSPPGGAAGRPGREPASDWPRH